MNLLIALILFICGVSVGMFVTGMIDTGARAIVLLLAGLLAKQFIQFMAGQLFKWTIKRYPKDKTSRRFWAHAVKWANGVHLTKNPLHCPDCN